MTDAATVERHFTLTGQLGAVSELDWTMDGSRLATGARDGVARVYEVTEGGAAEMVAVAARDGAIAGLAFSPDGQRLLTGDLNVTAAKIWDIGVNGGAEWLNLPTSARDRPVATFTPDGEGLALSGDGHAAVLWDLEGGTPRQRFGDDLAAAWAMAMNPAGDLVATLGYDDPPRVHVWDTTTGTLAFSVSEVAFWPTAAAWSPDGDLLAIAGQGPTGVTRIVDRSGRQVAEVVVDDNLQPLGVAFGPDGDQRITHRLDLARNDPTVDTVKVWNWATGEEVSTLPVFTDVFAVDPTGTRIATGDVGAGGSIWDTTTGTRVATLTGHTGDITDTTFSRDGATVATAGADATVRLWNTETGAQELVLPHDGQAWSVAFSPDGDRPVSTGFGLARVWALDVDDLIGIAETRLTRSLTDEECRQYLRVDGCPA